MSHGRRRRVLALGCAALALLAAAAVTSAYDRVIGSRTYRPAVVGQRGVVAAGRHFAAQAGLRMLERGGNAVDAGVAATFAAAVTEISHFGLGGEVPIIIHLAARGETVVINGQGIAPTAASLDRFQGRTEITGNGPSGGTVPAVVDALAIALAEYGTLSLAEVLEPAITLADAFPWYDFLGYYMGRELAKIRAIPSGARVYLQGPRGTIPEDGSLFRQPELARTLRALAAEEQSHRARGRKDAIHAARELFYRGDIGQRIARAVQDAGGLMTAADLAGYRGRVEAPTRRAFKTRHGAFEVAKTGFWGQGPVLLQTLALLEGFDLERMGHNSTEYIHTVTEAMKLAFADRDAHYGDPDFASVPAAVLLSDTYAAQRRALIDPLKADGVQRPGDPAARGGTEPAGRTIAGAGGVPRGTRSARVLAAPTESPDTTCVNAADAQGNLFAAAPSSGWFIGGAFIAGDTGVPLGNRMQAFVLVPGHPNVVQGGKRPRTTLSPTVVLRDGRPFLALSSPGGDSQDQQALQVFLNVAVFGMPPQDAVEAPRFNSGHLEETFGIHGFRPNELEVEDRVPAGVVDALRRLGHKVRVIGPFMMNTGTAVAGFDAQHRTVFGAADVRRQRFVAAW